MNCIERFWLNTCIKYLINKRLTHNGRFGAMSALASQQRQCELERYYPAGSVVEAATAPSRLDVGCNARRCVIRLKKSCVNLQLNLKIKTMVDFNNDKLKIIQFIKSSISEFENELGKPLSIGIKCTPSKGNISISFNKGKEIDKKILTTEQFEYKNHKTFHSKEWQKEYEQSKSCWFLFEESGVLEFRGVDKSLSINRLYSYFLWDLLRDMTKEIFLPTTLLELEQNEYSQIILHSNSENFGRAIVEIFRETQYDSFLEQKEYILKVGYDKYVASINPNISMDLKTPMIERASFFASLTDEQNKILNKLVLSILDSTAFNVMRAIEENNSEITDFSVLVGNKNVTKLPLIGGSLFGEYFDWVKRFSKYGEFQQ